MVRMGTDLRSHAMSIRLMDLRCVLETQSAWGFGTPTLIRFVAFSSFVILSIPLSVSCPRADLAVSLRRYVSLSPTLSLTLLLR